MYEVLKAVAVRDGPANTAQDFKVGELAPGDVVEALELGTTVRALHFPLSHSFSHTNLKSPCAEQAVMIPAYLGCILAKSACTWDLWYNLNCARKCLRLYNILSIYTWCRVFIGLFGRTVMFQDSLYSVSILLAGAVCLPSMGPGMMCIAFLVIGAYQLSVYSFGSDHFKATQL